MPSRVIGCEILAKWFTPLSSLVYSYSRRPSLLLLASYGLVSLGNYWDTFDLAVVFGGFFCYGLRPAASKYARSASSSFLRSSCSRLAILRYLSSSYCWSLTVSIQASRSYSSEFISAACFLKTFLMSFFWIKACLYWNILSLFEEILLYDFITDIFLA